MDLSNRQWRALAQAFPYYFSQGAATAEVVREDEETTQNRSTKRAEFEQFVVPRASKAFQKEVEAFTDSAISDLQAQSRTDAVQSIMAHLFGRPSVFSTSSPSSTFISKKPACSYAPLSLRELQLLGLYHRKQEQYEYVYNEHQHLLEASKSAVRTLLSAFQTLSTEITHESHDGGMLDSTRENLLWFSRSDVNANGGSIAAAALRPISERSGLLDSAVLPPPDAMEGFTSALANLPYTVVTQKNEGGAAGAVGDRVGQALPLSSLVVINRCAGCGEVDGDLLVCTQCGEVRHEACGGPHPPERSRVDGSLPTVNVCRKCAKELNLSSSSSSLHSSTSSSERAELDEYFDSEEDTDSSLSGFVVRSSEEKEDDEEEGEESSISESGGSRSSSFHRYHSGHRGSDSEKEGVRGKHRTSHLHRSTINTQSLNTRKGRETVHKRRRDDRRRDVDDGTDHRRRRSSNTGSDAEDSALHWQDERRRKKETKKHHATPSKGEGEGSSSSSSAAPPAKALHQSSCSRNSSYVKTQDEQNIGKKASNGVVPLSTQERHLVQDEEDELTMLGIIAPKSGNTPPGKEKSKAPTSSADTWSVPSQTQQRQQRRAFKAGLGKNAKVGGRSVVNVASSSSSSSDSE